MKNRIPYGYRIEDGLAVPVPEQVNRLRVFLERYAAGFSMKEAAVIAGIECSPGCCRRMLTNPVYLGSDEYYPQILPEHLMEEAEEEYERRRAGYPGRKQGPQKRPVPVQTVFRMGRHLPLQTEDPAEFAAQFYAGIQPKVNKNRKAAPDNASGVF